MPAEAQLSIVPPCGDSVAIPPAQVSIRSLIAEEVRNAMVAFLHAIRIRDEEMLTAISAPLAVDQGPSVERACGPAGFGDYVQAGSVVVQFW